MTANDDYAITLTHNCTLHLHLITTRHDLLTWKPAFRKLWQVEEHSQQAQHVDHYDLWRKQLQKIHTSNT